ncbi:hypothetical protein [Montanilutibacter psychrotolerans]|uniref:TIGR02677 family protein n=1 Tax=Montanilutibacter psychrotolerans TaxID=1327343 RepID=A0A3M8T0P4_9GAMM|nr:hypothetical protein [Lysobacter psychrotolerans]RNF85094.1 hypothetical protein EER27_04740 [Lysobacter psychrotolerans]
MTSDSPEPLHEFLAPGIEADDISALFPLLRGRDMLRAFTALFHGGEGGVLARLLVLRTLGARAEAPEWSLQEIREQLAYLDATKLDTVVARLKEHDLLVWDAATTRYRISPLGRKALTAVAGLLQFDDDDHDGLGYITAQLAAGQAMGRVGAEELGHLLSRMNELKDDFDRAVLSGSEHRIRAAAASLDSVWHWIEKGTRVIQSISEDPGLESTTHRMAQAVGRAQSALLRQTGVFQRALNQIDQHRVHLGDTGLSSSDLVEWLRGRDAADLVSQVDHAHCLPLPPRWVLDGIALDVAEFELVDRERAMAEATVLPPAESAPETAVVETQEEDLSPLLHWRDRLGSLAGVADLPALSELVPGQSYADSAWRLSLLTLLGDRESAALEGPVAEIARLPLQLSIEPTLVELPHHPQVRAISAGALLPAAKDT